LKAPSSPPPAAAGYEEMGMSRFRDSFGITNVTGQCSKWVSAVITVSAPGFVYWTNQLYP